MNNAYKQLIEDAKSYYAEDHDPVAVISDKGVVESCEFPNWHEIEFDKSDHEEINLWNYWQGVGVEHPYLMVVGQDWGHFDSNRPDVANIKRIAENPDSKVYCHDGISEKKLKGGTDARLKEAFEKNLKRDLFKHRYSDLYFTNLCLGYRTDKDTGHFEDDWLVRDANKFFGKLIDIKQPEVIVCLGLKTSAAAHKVLTGENLLMPNGFYKYIDEQGEGIELVLSYGKARFIVMAHPGSWGASNRKRFGKPGGNVIDDWAFLKKLDFPKDVSII